jgi:hypothetical protein
MWPTATPALQKSGIAPHVLLGGSFNVGGGVSFDPYVMYRIAKLKDFTGTLTDNRGEEHNGTLSVCEDSVTGPGGSAWMTAPCRATSPPAPWNSIFPGFRSVSRGVQLLIDEGVFDGPRLSSRGAFFLIHRPSP